MSAENGPSNIVPSPAIKDLVYGDHTSKRGSLAAFLREGTDEYGREFASKRADYWLELMKDTFKGSLNSPLKSIIFSPKILA